MLAGAIFGCGEDDVRCAFSVNSPRAELLQIRRLQPDGEIEPPRNSGQSYCKRTSKPDVSVEGPFTLLHVDAQHVGRSTSDRAKRKASAQLWYEP